MKSIGGYFELELPKGSEYHKKAIALNSGRHCFEYILRLRKYIKVYLPYYTCEVILEPIKKLNLQYEYYHINEKLEPHFDFSLLQENEAFLYTNYFGLKDKYINTLPSKHNIIIDNCQSFFSKPLPWFDTFYSPRKFFGVPDGGYLYTYDNSKLDLNLEQATSYNRCSHLLKRIDFSAEKGYNDYKKNDSIISSEPLMIMSNLTHRLLSSIDYNYCKVKRQENFIYFHRQLENINLLNIDLMIGNKFIPMNYPLLIEKPYLRRKLINQKIFIPQYWENVFNWTKETDYEQYLTRYLIALPIDQRYGIKDKFKTNLFHIGFGDMKYRKDVYEFFVNNGWEGITIIHPSAIIGPDARIGKGVLIEAGCLITPNPIIGDNVIINTGSQVNHDNIIHNHVHIASGVVASGSIEIGENTLIDDGAIITMNQKVGSNCIIGAGSVVTKDIPDGKIAYGIPCRIVRNNI